jgi:hypothetical protein
MFETLSEFNQILREAFFMEIEDLQKKPGRNGVSRKE